MQGEYRGDFTRDTFHRANHVSRVLMQQGRVQLDADWNEQTSILLHYLWNLGADLIGQHGGTTNGFKITPATNNDVTDLQIAGGHYYVDGMLCENSPALINGTSTPLTYFTQPEGPVGNGKNTLPSAPLLVYLDVWERHLTYMQQERLREVALGGPDTASRAKIVWQVKISSDPYLLKILAKLTKPASTSQHNSVDIPDPIWQDCISRLQPTSRGLLKAQVQTQTTSTDPCVISPQSSYRGNENQLYRVEVHNDGLLTETPTFKWSRENSSVAFPILKLATSANQTTVTLASLGRDDELSLKVKDWVEVVDDNSSLTGKVDSLMQVLAIDATNLIVTLAGISSIVVDQPPTRHPILRRWEGTAPISERTDAATNWLTLEDGIQIQFQSATPASQYRSGDYWLIPARVATGSIEWPQQTDTQGNQGPAALPPHGVDHHYAPLAYISATTTNTIADLRRTINSVAKSTP